VRVPWVAVVVAEVQLSQNSVAMGNAQAPRTDQLVETSPRTLPVRCEV
jgi:hypothetical protein